VDGLVERLASSRACLYIILHCVVRGRAVSISQVGERVRRRFCRKYIEGNLTGVVPEADHSILVSRLRTSGVMPSLLACVHGAYRDKCTFVFTLVFRSYYSN
jgi:hypothetical protein